MLIKNRIQIGPGDVLIPRIPFVIKLCLKSLKKWKLHGHGLIHYQWHTPFFSLSSCVEIFIRIFLQTTYHKNGFGLF
ncbi:hypothetical protein BGS_0201 [Beggiatoa sp. SS]|nr:hypothetical protein BGS_0201 [Beggiatoa sp. SS]